MSNTVTKKNQEKPNTNVFKEYLTPVSIIASGILIYLSILFQADVTDGNKVGVSGTPNLFVNGTRIVGAQPYQAFKSAIDAELNK